MAINNYFNATPVSIDFNAVKQVDSKPAASGFADGNIIFDKTEQQFYQALNGSWIALDFIGDDFTVNKLAFNTAATETLVTGELAWNVDDETVDMHVGDAVTIQLGQEMVYHVINQTGSQIDNGTVVMADGALGASGKIKVVPAIADGSVPAKYIMGVATEDIPNGALGYVTAFGKVRGFNTSSYSSGTVLYASATSSGSFTDTAPSLPNQKVTVAITLDQKSNGNIFVRPTYDDRRKSVSSISDLENVNTAENDVVYLDAGGRSGWFKWNSSDDLSTEVANDTEQGIYVAPSGEDGSNGAWVRNYSGQILADWFGAVGDSSTDSTDALNNAFNLNEVRELSLSRGTYIINDTIVIPTGRALIGVSALSTQLEAGNTFPVDTHMIQMGAEDGLPKFGVRVQNLYVDCNHVSGSTGIRNAVAQEGSIVDRVSIFNFGKYGVHHLSNVDSAGNCEYNNLWIANSKQASTAGTRHIFATAGQRSGALWGRITCVNSSAGTNTWNVKPDYYIEFSNHQGFFYHSNIEAEPVQIAAVYIRNFSTCTFVQTHFAGDPPIGFLIDDPGVNDPQGVTLIGTTNRDLSSGTTIKDNSYNVDIKKTYVSFFNSNQGYFVGRFRSTVETIADGDTTPSVSNSNVFDFSNTSPTTVTNFDDANNGQVISMRLDANTTISHNANIRLSGGVNYSGTANDTLTLVRIAGIWFETARSVNV